MEFFNIDSRLLETAKKAEELASAQFAKISETAEYNGNKVLSAFINNRVSEMHLKGTIGYGYNDDGRDKLDMVYAEVFHTEDALVRHSFVNGTHTLSTALFGILRPNDTLLCVTGAPYDTLTEVINGEHGGSLKEFGVKYAQVDLLPDGTPDLDGIKAAAAKGCKVAYIQRSRGYSLRESLSVDKIGEIISAVRSVNSDAIIMVDNCYGEFTDVLEPTHVGADIIAGSLIKNPGGGIAPTGGYVAGKKELVERAAMRLTTPGIGGECGSTLGNNRLLYQGLFMAPHTVAQALKTAVFCAAMMDELGVPSSPAIDEKRSDIIQMVKLGSADAMKRFCLGIQAGAPVDSYVTPEPWPMPGYNCPVIMAAGAFVQGASIELSADGPMREPYIVYMQGGLTFESGKLGIMMAASAMLGE